LKWFDVSEVLRKLTFVVLGPLWEDTRQAGAVQTQGSGRWALARDWTPGSLPPEIAAQALLAAATFLPAATRTPDCRRCLGVALESE
jgi:hypothetical protein